MRYSLLLAGLFLLIGCTKKEDSTGNSTALLPEPEATSFAGKPLYPKPADTLARRKADSVLSLLQAKNDLSEDDYIEIGRQYVSTNRYRLAVANYTEGLKKYPESFKLLRNRGHRYITLRELDKAIADLEKAEKLIRNQPDVWEYDAAGKPVATYQHQIWYHMGVYNYLTKNYAEAASAFEHALAATKETKNMVGASDWLYNCYMRSGQEKKAEELLKPFTATYDTDRDHPYFRRIMLYKGLIKPEDLMDENIEADKMTVLDITKMYGLANWYAYHGNKEKANTLYWKILSTKNWEGFAYAASEKEVDNSAPKH